jgi:hypothetical protein
VLWQPGRADEIASKFKDLHSKHAWLSFRPMIADERFISWSMQPHMGAIPQDIAVKFPNDFMHPWGWWVRLKAYLPWVRSRRARLAAVTLPGETIKPANLLKMSDGDTVRDEKGRLLIWSDATLGPLKQQIVDYYRDCPDALLV